MLAVNEESAQLHWWIISAANAVDVCKFVGVARGCGACKAACCHPRAGTFIDSSPASNSSFSQHGPDLNPVVKFKLPLMPHMQKISAGWMEMLTEHARNPTAPLPPMLNRLQNRSLLLFGDSLDDNLWATMCRCPRGGRPAGEASAVSGPEFSSPAITCFSKAGPGCEPTSLGFHSCTYNALGLHLHFSNGGDYGVHPFGNFPFGRGQHPPCDGALDTQASCLHKKWGKSCNTAFGFSCMRNSTCRAPTAVVMNHNLCGSGSGCNGSGRVMSKATIPRHPISSCLRTFRTPRSSSESCDVCCHAHPCGLSAPTRTRIWLATEAETASR